MKVKHNPSLLASSSDLFPEEICPICLEAARLVRDHDHVTGFVRGRICESCNSKLGLLERHPESYYLRKKPGRHSWRRWVHVNAERIWVHLQQTTNEVYERRRSAVRIPPEAGQAPVTTTRSGAGRSRANTCSNSRPKAESLRSPDPDRLAWAREQIRRAREGDP